MTDLSDDLLDGPVGPAKALPDVRRPRGFEGVSCLLCGAEGTVSVHLDQVTTFHCSECSDSWDAEGVREAIAAWTSVLRWVALAPTLG
jgi:hypothetical protein